MQTCKKCNKEFKRRGEIDGRNYDLHNRLHCLDCAPLDSYKAKGSGKAKITKPDARRIAQPSPDAIYSNSWDGGFRWLLPINCKQCNNIKYVPHNLVKNNRSHYCNKECSSLARRTEVEVSCFWCKTVFKKKPSSILKSKSGLCFCSRTCKENAQSLEGGCKEIQPYHYNNGTGISSYREKALKAHGPSCQKCGYKENEKMLDVHHIDSNRENNILENLQVLCVWCHIAETRKVIPHPWTGKILL